MKLSEWKKVNDLACSLAGIASSDAYDVALEVERKCNLNEPNFTDAERDYIYERLEVGHSARIRKFNDILLAREAWDRGVV